jgi:pimeloyl-ACP methyl ester carboxylesterase
MLLTRFRATMDHWDPAFLDILASERRVILFDNAGVSESTGEVATTFAGMAETAVDFITALGLTQVDLLDWSIGGFAGQVVALNHPSLVRRLLVAGSGPGGVPGSPALDPKVAETMTAPASTEEHFLYLFFGLDEESQRVGKESLKRLEPRLSKSHAEVSAEAWGRQLQAIMKWAGGEGSAWSRLEEITIPVLVANGAHDVMVDAGDSFAMVRRRRRCSTGMPATPSCSSIPMSSARPRWISSIDGNRHAGPRPETSPVPLSPHLYRADGLFALILHQSRRRKRLLSSRSSLCLRSQHLMALPD